MSILGDAKLDGAIEKAAREHTRSPQQRDAFVLGAEHTAALITAMGIEKTLLPSIRREANELRELVIRGERAAAALSLVADGASLSTRAQEAIALTSILTRHYHAALSAEESFGAGSYRRETVSAQAQVQIVRAVSYIVWAVLNPGLATPAPEAGEEAA